MSKNKVKWLLPVIIFFSFYSNVFANQAIMNPVEVNPSRVIRNGHGQGPADEPRTEDLKAELRVTPPASEVIQLLEEDDTRSTDQSSKQQNGLTQDLQRMDCSKITMQIFQVLLQNPDTVEPEDYSCGLLNLISHFEKSTVRIRSLEASLHSATNTIKSLESSLHTELSKNQFMMKELNETVHKETERAIKAENVIARRVLSEKTRVDNIQKNLTEILNGAQEKIKDLESTMRTLEGWSSKHMLQKEPLSFSPSPQIMGHMQPTILQSSINEQEIQKIELKLNSLSDFIQDLSNRISQMEDGSQEHVNKGITQIFKTYASLAHEIETETERASSEEAALKSYINNEITTVTKSINAIQERIAEEKNRVQVIENRRTADLFEEINRAKAEENRLDKKLKDEMSKAAAAFKRLELHVDSQMNSTKSSDTDFHSLTNNITKRATEIEEKLTEQLNFERTRALSVENSLKAHLETEVSRAMSAENELKKMTQEERDRARIAEQELKVQLEVEVYRAKGVELSLTAQITSETEKTNSSMTRLLTDYIKEFTRAQNAEKELEDKIINERSRATLAEQSLKDSLDLEKNRALDKELELFGLLKNQENSTKLMDQVRNLIEAENVRATQAESNLESQINAEVVRARGSEDKLHSMLNGDLIDKFKAVENNVTATTSDILRHAKELELEVRKTVMAEVARAVDSENALKQQLNLEVLRATQAEFILANTINSNYSDISSRFREMSGEIEKDSLRLEDISLQISRNLTSDILTLAELFDDKLDDLERSENIRLKKVEEDMKKCCSGSSWRWRSPKTGKSSSNSGGEGVINKIMQVFGSLADDNSNNSNRKSGGKSSKTSQERSLRTGADEEKDDIHSKQIESKNSTLIINPKFTVLNETLENSGQVLERARKRRPSGASRTSRRVNGNSNQNQVQVQTVNSKVTSTFG